MAEGQRLSEVEGPPFTETDLVMLNHIEAAVRQYPNELAVISCHQNNAIFSEEQQTDADNSPLRWSFLELWELAGVLGKALMTKGFSPDQSLVVLLRSQAEWALACWVALRVGSTFVPMHPKILDSPVELKYQLEIARPGAIIAADGDTARRLAALEPQLIQEAAVKVIASPDANIDETWIPLKNLMIGRDSTTTAPSFATRTADDIALLLFTGGTTSLPKPAPTKNSLGVLTSTSVEQKWHIKPGCRAVSHLPTFHSFSVALNTGFWFGGGCAVFPADTYSPAASLEAIERHSCTHLPGNPAMVESLIHHPSATSRNLTSLILVAMGGSILHPEVVRKCQAPPLNAKSVCSSYALTETLSCVGWGLYEKKPEFTVATSPGKVTNGVKLRICAPGSRDLVPWGEVGQLHIGNPFIYKDFPGRDKSWLYSEGPVNWVITGDQATFGAEGELYILGRYKDLIIRGGRNISPASIENVLNALPGLEAVVVGLADEIAGEVPVAIINFTSEVRYTDKVIRETIINSLGRHCSPQRIIKLEQLGLQSFPLTRAGKFDKTRLNSLAANYCSEDRDNPGEAGAEPGNADELMRMEKVLAGVWAELSAQQPEEITSVSEFADSLLMLQATSLIERRTNKRITLEEIISHPSIQQQAALLSKKTTRKLDDNKVDLRALGPPSASEIAHVQNDSVKYARTVELTESKLAQYNLTWDDVEDVFPLYDNARFMVSSAPRRSQSWCNRIVHRTNVGPQDVEKSLKETLRYHPVLRSLAVQFDEETWFHAVPKYDDKWLNQVVTVSTDNVTEAELASYRLDDPNYDHVSRDGVLLKATILQLKECTTGVVIHANHVAFDALSMSLFFEDFNLCLSGNADQRAPRVPYKLFANAFYHGRGGLVAKSDCEFFISKLQGCGADKNAQWPPKRSVGYAWGALFDWIDHEGRPLDASVRTNVARDVEQSGYNGLSKNIPVTDELNSQYKISLVAVFKTAVAMFNVHKTKAAYALFSHWEAGRSLPFFDGNPTYHDSLPNPMNIPGEMGERIVDKIDVSTNETILTLLGRIQDDTTTTTRHAHAPLYSVIGGLAANDRSETAARDAEVAYDTLQRQVFNWIPTTPALRASSEKLLTSVSHLARADLGFAWTASRVDRQTVNFMVRWDDAHMEYGEAQSALDDAVACAQWLMDRKNWNRTVGEWWEEYEGRHV